MPQWTARLFLGFTFVLAAAHASGAPEIQANAKTIKYNEYDPIRWTPDGKHIVIKNRWWYTPANKTFVGIKPPSAVFESSHYWTLRSSPDNQNLMWHAPGGERILVRRLNGSSVTETLVPAWLGEDKFGISFWLNDQEIFVQQTDLSSHSEKRSDYVACGIFNIKRNTWIRRPGTACVEGDFHAVTNVEHLYGKTYLVGSGAEGHGVLEVKKIDFATMRHTVYIDINYGTTVFLYEPPSQIQYRSPELVKFIFRCEVHKAHGVDCHENSTGAALYSWKLSDKKLRLLQKNLPDNVALATAHDRLAWLDKESICVGKPGEKKTISCTPLPDSKK